VAGSASATRRRGRSATSGFFSKSRWRRPGKDRPRASRCSCSPCFIRSRSGIPNSLKTKIAPAWQASNGATLQCHYGNSTVAVSAASAQTYRAPHSSRNSPHPHHGRHHEPLVPSLRHFPGMRESRSSTSQQTACPAPWGSGSSIDPVRTGR